MNEFKVIKNINRSLNKKRPEKFNHQWIKNRCRISYEFIISNIKNELDEPDWDLIISKLERHNQRLWMKKTKRQYNTFYSSQNELDIVLRKYKNKLYTFISQADKEDKIICDWISIRLARLSQKGNVDAKNEAINLIKNLVDQWIEHDKSLYNWKGYDELVVGHIAACIHRFRYAGSFLGYLHRTLQYAGLGLIPIEKFSLDDHSPVTGKRLIETFINKYV